jgi:hypothetical protein
MYPRERKGRVGNVWKELLFLGMFMVCVSVVLTSESEGAPNPIPFATIEFESDDHTVRSMPYCLTVAVVPGEVTIYGCAGIARITVYLTAEQMEGWDVVVEPSVIAFINPDSERFLAIVTVPPGVEPGERQLTVRLSVHAADLAPIEANATSSIEVIGHHYASIGPVWPACNLSEDGKVRYDMIVWNLGTVNDTYVFRIEYDDGVIRPLEGPSALAVPARQRVLVTFVLKIDDAMDVNCGETLSFTMRSETGTGDWSAPMSYQVGYATTEVVVLDHDWRSSGWACGLGNGFIYIAILEILWVVAIVLIIDRRVGPRSG